jgi:cold shock CspA family protein
MRSDWQRGKLVKWNDDRGFGFIRSEHQSQEVFLHILDVDRAMRSPRVGDIILYQTRPGKQGKPRACHAKIQGATAPTK